MVYRVLEGEMGRQYGCPSSRDWSPEAKSTQRGIGRESPLPSWVMTEHCWGRRREQEALLLSGGLSWGSKGGGCRAANWEVWALQSHQVTRPASTQEACGVGGTETYSSHPLVSASPCPQPFHRRFSAHLFLQPSPI